MQFRKWLFKRNFFHWLTKPQSGVKGIILIDCPYAILGHRLSQPFCFQMAYYLLDNIFSRFSII